jgi:hypothetical protein
VPALTLIDAIEVDVDAFFDDDGDGERVLVSPADLERATGWELKPEGLCRGPVCVPFRSSSDRVDVHAVASALGRAFVVSREGSVAALAGDPMSSGATASIDELELPDLDGHVVRMSDHAGRKRMLVAWASW